MTRLCIALRNWLAAWEARQAGERSHDEDVCPYHSMAQQAAWYRGRRDRETVALMAEW